MIWMVLCLAWAPLIWALAPETVSKEIPADRKIDTH